MKLLSQTSDLKAVSGGYDEFVTENVILFHSVKNGAVLGIFGAAVGACMGSSIYGFPGGVVLGALCAAGGAYIGYNFNEYSDIEPNTWVRWHIIYV